MMGQNDFFFQKIEQVVPLRQDEKDKIQERLRVCRLKVTSVCKAR
jgi:hypothetical protein